MNLLLDTNVLLWWLFDMPQLGETGDVIAAEGNLVFVSAVTAFEITTKQAIGKLEAPDDLEQQIEAHGFEPLSITVAHGIATGKLPLHHRDPFDRMLVAQARCEGLILLTGDRTLQKYDVPLMLC